MELWSQQETASLGFGCMRLPTQFYGGEHIIKQDELYCMVDHFIESGFTYFDVARGYHQGACEGALKKALIDRHPRDSFKIASKLSAYLVANKDLAEKMFFISLEDTQAEYFDYYLLHNLGEPRTVLYEEYDLWNFLAYQKKVGLIDKLGFSFHGTASELEEILTNHTVDFVQLQVNYHDWTDEIVQSRACLEVARSHDLEIIVMEPVKGGLLAQFPPGADELFDAEDVDASPVECALQFTASLDGVSTVLSGMSSLKQMEENCAFFNRIKPITTTELLRYEKISALLKESRLIPCTNCGYCKDVCPESVAIPRILNSLNILTHYGDSRRARQDYLWALPGKASLCKDCKSCEKVCPQRIEITRGLKQAVQDLECDDIDSVEFS